MDSKYFSTFTGNEISYVIKSLEDMHPIIKIINANNIATITCKSTSPDLEYEEEQTVIDGECKFDLPGYANYEINYINSDIEVSISQSVYAFRIFEIDLSN